MKRSAFVSSVLATAVLLTACGGEDTTGTSPAAIDRPAASTPPVEPSAPTPATTPDETTGAEPTEAEPTEAGAAQDDGTDDEIPDGGTEGLPGRPIESIPTHGGRYWAAYLAVGAPGDPALQQVLAAVQESWPGAGLAELGCDEGAAAALGRSPTEHAVAVYFPTEQHITEFRRRWEAPFLGAVHVTTRCAD